MSKQIPTKREMQHILLRLDDAAAVTPVVDAAMRLCCDALGDDALWAATTPLRDALTEWNGGVPPHADDEYWRTREANAR